MAVLSLLVAGVLSCLVGARLSDYILLFFYHRRYLSEPHYMELFDISDNDFNYSMYTDNKGKKPKTYADFMRMHQNARDEAYGIYRKHLIAVGRHSLILIALTLFLPVIFFYKFWFLYLATYLVAIVGFILYKRFKKDNEFAFYASLMINLIISDVASRQKD